VTLVSKSEDRVWKAVCERKRRRIIDVLAEGPKSTGEIIDLFPSLGRTGVMKHIGILEDADLIIVRREGRTRWNYLNPKPLDQVCSGWVDKHVAGIAASVERLKRLAEKAP
jgi:DNA-binding transcriptional ArsR family regulator